MAAKLGRFLESKSLGCQVTLGRCSAKYPTCVPDPEAISRALTGVSRGMVSFRTCKIGSLLRSAEALILLRSAEEYIVVFILFAMNLNISISCRSESSKYK